jgi:hypothetical protein
MYPDRTLRVPSEQASKVSPLADVPSASAGTAGWTPAERHLLTAHRDEVAMLFIDAFRAKVAADEVASSLFQQPAEGHRRWPGEVARIVTAATLPGRSAEDLRGLQVEDASGLPDYEVLAVCAERFAPSSLTGLYRAVALILAERYTEAIRLLEQFDVAGASLATRWATWDLRGTALGEAGLHRQALVAFSRAWQGDQSKLRPLIAALVEAMQARDEASVRLAVGILDEVASPGTMEPYTAMFRQKRRVCRWAPTPETRKFTTQLEDGFGPASALITRAFLNS